MSSYIRELLALVANPDAHAMALALVVLTLRVERVGKLVKGQHDRLTQAEVRLERIEREAGIEPLEAAR